MNRSGHARTRRRWARAALLAAPVALLGLYFASSAANHFFFEVFVGKVVAFSLVTAFTLAVVVWVQPRVPPEPRRQRAVLGFAEVGSFAMFLTALGWWMTAVETNALAKAPTVRTATELRAEHERTKSFPTDRGLFLVGTVRHRSGDAAAPEGDAAEVVAYYDDSTSISSLSGRDAWFPLAIDVTLTDGTACRVAGIAGRRQTWNWRADRRHAWRRSLHAGDAVVVWGRPAESTGMADGVRHWGLQETRLIAHGTLDEFTAGFLGPAVATARVFGWAGFGAMFLALVPAGMAWRCFRRGRKLPP